MALASPEGGETWSVICCGGAAFASEGGARTGDEARDGSGAAAGEVLVVDEVEEGGGAFAAITIGAVFADECETGTAPDACWMLFGSFFELLWDCALAEELCSAVEVFEANPPLWESLGVPFEKPL
jgi:hypothetical protein